MRSFFGLIAFLFVLWFVGAATGFNDGFVMGFRLAKDYTPLTHGLSTVYVEKSGSERITLPPVEYLRLKKLIGDTPSDVIVEEDNGSLTMKFIVTGELNFIDELVWTGRRAEIEKNVFPNGDVPVTIILVDSMLNPIRMFSPTSEKT